MVCGCSTAGRSHRSLRCRGAACGRYACAEGGGGSRGGDPEDHLGVLRDAEQLPAKQRLEGHACVLRRQAALVAAAGNRSVHFFFFWRVTRRLCRPTKWPVGAACDRLSLAHASSRLVQVAFCASLLLKFNANAYPSTTDTAMRRQVVGHVCTQLCLAGSAVARSHKAMTLASQTPKHFTLQRRETI